MENILGSIKTKTLLKSTVFDFFAIMFIYFAPTLSHLTNFPLYYFDPMRFVLILALVHTKKENAFIIAFTLPLFSFFVSSHPVFAKAGLIMMELSLNLVIFYYLTKKFNNVILPIFISIIASKIVYYLLKYFLINTYVLDGQLFSTPVFLQFAAVLLFSSYVYFLYKEK
ncbi:MAG: hypothetical protein V1773_00790 [bacterium]